MDVRVEQLSINYGSFRAVDNLSLTIGDGELLALLGPSGCGKSTTLLAIGGFEEAAAGRVLFGGRDVTDMPPRQRNIGICFQSYALYPTKTVRENIAFPMRLKRESAERIKAKVHMMAEMLELGDYLDRMPSELSGGQQQRVSLARALAKEPGLLLLDEPLSNLDARLRIGTRAQIKSIQRKTAIPTIIVTHDQLEAMCIADRIAIMREGRLEQVGTPQECYHRPQSLFVGSFIGTHSINLIKGELSPPDRFKFEGSEAFEINGLMVDEDLLTSPQVTIAIRPEYVSIADSGDLSGEVMFVEPLGRDHLVTCNTPVGTIRALVDETEAPRVGDRIAMEFHRSSILVFDSATGENRTAYNNNKTDKK